MAPAEKTSERLWIVETLGCLHHGIARGRLREESRDERRRSAVALTTEHD
jgi:hypothetical protein